MWNVPSVFHFCCFVENKAFSMLWGNKKVDIFMCWHIHHDFFLTGISQDTSSLLAANCGLCQLDGEGHTYLFTRFTLCYSKIQGEEFTSQGVLMSIMAHHWLLIWIVLGCCLGSTVLFHSFAGWVWRGYCLPLIYVNLLSAQKFLMTLWLWNTSSMTGPQWNMDRVQCVFSTGHCPGPDPKWRKGTGQPSSWLVILEHGMVHARLSIPTVQLPARTPPGAVELFCFSL